MVILGILVNYNHKFKSYSDICDLEDVNCTFYVIDKRNFKEPVLT